MSKRPILCIVGCSGVGKTSFMEKVVAELKKRGLKIATIKHDAHDRFEIDKPGKDSWRHKKAGARVSIISSPKRVGMIMDVDHDYDPQELLDFLDVDFVIAEGYKRSNHPKIEVVKKNTEPICKDDKNLIAIIGKYRGNLDVPQFQAHQVNKVVNLILKYFNI